MELEKHHKIEIFVVVVLIIFVALSFTWNAKASNSDGLLHVYFLDVGQGDGIFIKSPSGNQMLIDGGPDRGVLERLGEVMPINDRKIEVILNTHTDSDHLAGLVDVIKRYDADSIVETGMYCETVICNLWEDEKSKKGIESIIVYSGYVIELDEGVILTVLNPERNMAGEKISKSNNTSIVLKLQYGEQSVLLTGDIEKSVEEKLSRGADIDVDFLKIAHHGSKTSTADSFLRATSPLASFISSGKKNTYGHPAQLVLDRLGDMGVKYYRTDELGTIELVLDGTQFLIK